MTFVAVSVGVGVASLGYSVYKGEKASSEAKKIRESNQRPTYQIPDEYKQNLQLAKQMAQIGMPQQAYNNQADAIRSNQAGAVSALGNSANPGAGLAQIVRAGNNSIGQLNAQDALARQQGTRGVMQANKDIANQKLNAQQYNQFDKYSENFNRAQALEGAANTDFQNAANGASGLAGGLAMYGARSTGGTGTSTTSTDLQIPQQYWNSPGLGYQNQPSVPYGTNWDTGQNWKYKNPYFPQ